ncbi:MAG: hypothetical protein U5Q44_03725 [Dehalococcoidia bacterium]|nr:hypothetical protein [Dehalococcoidia bacterium]
MTRLVPTARHCVDEQHGPLVEPVGDDAADGSNGGHDSGARDGDDAHGDRGTGEFVGEEATQDEVHLHGHEEGEVAGEIPGVVALGQGAEGLGPAAGLEDIRWRGGRWRLLLVYICRLPLVDAHRRPSPSRKANNLSAYQRESSVASSSVGCRTWRKARGTRYEEWG